MKFKKFISEVAEVVSDDEADLQRIVDGAKAAVSKSQINGIVQQAGNMYKLYGDEWLERLEKALRVDIVPDFVDRFIEYTKNFSLKMGHLKQDSEAE